MSAKALLIYVRPFTSRAFSWIIVLNTSSSIMYVLNKNMEKGTLAISSLLKRKNEWKKKFED